LSVNVTVVLTSRYMITQNVWFNTGIDIFVNKPSN